MTVSESYGTPDETSLTDNPDVRTAHARPSQHTQRLRSGLRRVLGLLAGLTVLAMLGVLAYNLATSYFALNGAWYGPLRIQVGSGRVSLEAYMDISTYLNGNLSGSGTFCSKNPLGGETASVDLKVSGIGIPTR